MQIRNNACDVGFSLPRSRSSCRRARAAPRTSSFGGRLYHEKADCQFCHGVNGDGRGDPRSPGKASDLHVTKLDREQLVEVIKCGRPGSEMPHFDKYAYEDKTCYGLSAADLGAAVAAATALDQPDQARNRGAGRLHPGYIQRKIGPKLLAADQLEPHGAFKLAFRLLSGLRIDLALAGLSQMPRRERRRRPLVDPLAASLFDENSADRSFALRRRQLLAVPTVSSEPGGEEIAQQISLVALFASRSLTMRMPLAMPSTSNRQK